MTLSPEELARIRALKTSELLAVLNPEIAADAIEDARSRGAEVTDELIQAFMQAIGNELDRRIPVPDVPADKETP